MLSSGEEVSQEVSINSPSGEGGGLVGSGSARAEIPLVSINSPSGEGGGRTKLPRRRISPVFKVSINSPSGEGGGLRPPLDQPMIG